jgi:hypothetical protein
MTSHHVSWRHTTWYDVTSLLPEWTGIQMKPRWKRQTQSQITMWLLKSTLSPSTLVSSFYSKDLTYILKFVSWVLTLQILSFVVNSLQVFCILCVMNVIQLVDYNIFSYLQRQEQQSVMIWWIMRTLTIFQLLAWPESKLGSRLRDTIRGGWENDLL